MADCLVIIDVQKGFLTKETKHILKKLEEVLKEEKRFDHIVGTKFLNTEGSPFVRFMDWKELMDEESQSVADIVQQHCEHIFEKNGYSCFTKDFEKYIKEKQIDKLYFVGIDSDGCVLKSAVDCFERNIVCEVLVDCCASTGGSANHAAGIAVMERMLGEKAVRR